MDKVYKRSLYDLIIFFIGCIALIIPDAKLIKYIIADEKKDSLIIIMFVVCMVFTIVLLLGFILECIRKKDAIKVSSGNLVIQEFKKTVIPLSDILDIKYRRSYIGTLGTLSKGDLFITKTDNKKIRVKDLRNVKTVCMELRKLIGED